MACQVNWTEAAWSDLEETAKYIARDSRNYAAAFVREVRDAARSLTSFAQRGHVVPEFSDPTVRELFVRTYRLIYQVKENQVSVLGFVHGARDLLGMWQR